MGARSEATFFLKLNGASFRRGLKDAQASLGRFTQQIKQHARRAALAFAAIGIAAGMVGAKFEQSMANVGSIAGASAQELRQLEIAARDMGATTAFSAQQAAEAQYALVSSGQDVRQVISTLPGVMMLAGATQADLASSAEIVTGALNAFKMEATEANRVVNLFAAGIKESPLTMQRLGESFSYASSSAASFGISIEETVATLGALHKANIKGGQAGTYFRQVMVALAERASSGAGSIGEALQGWDAASEGIAGALQRLEAAGVSSAMAFEELGAKSGTGLAALINQGSAAVVDLTKKVTGTNQAFEAYRKQMDTTSGRAKIFMSALQEAALRIFSVMSGPLNDAISAVTKAVQNNFDEITQAAEGVVSVITSLVKTAGDVIRFVYEWRAPIMGAVAAVGALSLAFYGAAAATAAWNAVMAINPIFLIAAAIGVAIGLIIKLVDHLGGWGAVWTRVVGGMRLGFEQLRFWFDALKLQVKHIGPVFSAIGQTFAVIGTGIVDTLKGIGKAIGSLFSNLWAVITGRASVEEAFGNVKKAFTDGIAGVQEETRGKLRGIWSGLNSEYDNEFALIQEKHAANVEAIKAATAASLEEGQRKEAGAGAGGAGGAAATDWIETELSKRTELIGAIRATQAARAGEFGPELIEAQELLYGEQGILRIDKPGKIIPDRTTEEAVRKIKKMYDMIRSIGSTAWNALAQEAQKTSKIEQISRLQLLKVFVAVVRESAAAYIEAKGKEAATEMVFEAAQALAALGRYDFAAAAKHGAAAAKFGLIATGAAVAASIARGGEAIGSGVERLATPSGSSIESDLEGGAAPGVSRIAGAGAGGVTVNQYNSFHFDGPLVGSGGMRELAELLIPELRAAGALGQTIGGA